MTLISLVGATLVLVAFIASNLNVMNSKGLVYGFLNFFGTGMLAVTVIEPLNLGVFIVETVWCLFSGYLIYRRLTGGDFNGI